MSTKYLSTAQVAELVGCHRETAAEALRDGTLHGYQHKAKGRWRIEPACALAWAEHRPCEHRNNVVELFPAKTA